MTSRIDKGRALRTYGLQPRTPVRTLNGIHRCFVPGVVLAIEVGHTTDPVAKQTGRYYTVPLVLLRVRAGFGLGPPLPMAGKSGLSRREIHISWHPLRPEPG